MKFYTNVQLVGDNFLVRGYENGKHFMTREKFNPTLFVPSKRQTKYKTLTGEYVESIKPGSVRECRDFVKKYGVPNSIDYRTSRARATPSPTTTSDRSAHRQQATTRPEQAGSP